MRPSQHERSLRKELRSVLPSDKDDLASVERLIAKGYPAVQPVLYDLLKWIRQESWPVAKPIRHFLVSIGPALAPEVGKALASRDDFWKAAILQHVVFEWPADDVRPLAPQLLMIATDGQSWGADLHALRLLARHGLGDRDWIEGWLEFKRNHHRTRLTEIAEILQIVNRGAVEPRVETDDAQ